MPERRSKKIHKLICKGNLWHVCAVNHLKEPDAQFEFIKCMIRDMSHGSPKEVALKCSPATSHTYTYTHIYETISSCATGPEGESYMLSSSNHHPNQGQELLEKAGNATSALRPPLSLTEGWSPT